VREGSIAVMGASAESATNPVSRLTSGSQDSQPDWSPDGTRILFVRSGAIFVMFADGSGQAGLIPGPGDLSPRWSPDGTRIAFSRDGMIVVAAADGSEERVLTAGSQPSWSPDGTQMALANDAGVEIV